MKPASPPAAARLWVLGVMLAGAALVAAFFWFVLPNPNDYYFGNGDGIQAYFTTSYYARYGVWMHFDGMNYPDADHINYTNMQPLVAGAMRLLELGGLPVARYTVGITNLLALLGLALAPVPLFLILRRSYLPYWYAALIALLIALLSPQVLRIGDHLALSYVAFFPWLWYCIVRLQEQPLAARWYVVFAVSLTLMGFIVPYYVALGALFLLGHVLLKVLRARKLGPLAWRMAVVAIVPLLVMQAWLWLTDSVADRPANPYGLLVYIASPSAIFLPVLPPLRTWWTSLWPLEPVLWEGWAYIGLAATFTLLFSGLTALNALVQRRSRAAFIQRWAAIPSFLRTGLWAATLLLLFSFAVPFRWGAFTWLIDHAGPVKQFRALGRFAWPFYYVSGCYAAYCLYCLWEKQVDRGVPRWQLVWLPLVLAGWAVEGVINVTSRTSEIRGLTGASRLLDPEAGLGQQLSWLNRRSDDFQAIMPLPYFHLGTDKFALPGSEASFRQSYNLAFTTGLPLLANHTTRASVGSAMHHVQLLSSPLIARTLLTRLPSEKPILLLVTPGNLTPAEERIQGLARQLYVSSEGALYELSVAALAATALDTERAQAVQQLPRLPLRPDGLRCTTNKGVMLRNFDDVPNGVGHLLPGAFQERAQKFSVLYDGPVPAPADTGKYEISVWVNGKTAYGLGNLQAKQYVGSDQVDHQVVSAMNLTEIDGDWLRVALLVRIRPGVTRLEVLYDNRELLADDLLIRPVDTDVYYFAQPGEPQSLSKNTYRLYPAGHRGASPRL